MNASNLYAARERLDSYAGKAPTAEQLLAALWWVNDAGLEGTGPDVVRDDPRRAWAALRILSAHALHPAEAVAQ